MLCLYYYDSSAMTDPQISIVALRLVHNTLYMLTIHKLVTLHVSFSPFIRSAVSNTVVVIQISVLCVCVCVCVHV